MRKVLKTVALAVFLVLLAGAAANAEVNINLYGASAQFLFWNDAADDFLTDLGCTGVAQAVDSTGKHGITRGTCGGETVYIRYSSKASYDGLYACKGQVPPPSAGGQPTCSGIGPRYREMADETRTNFSTHVVSGLTCKLVTIGASDVSGDTFKQISSGQLKGPAGGGFVSRNITPISMGTIPYYRPVVVPFGFFKNNSAIPNLTNLTRLQALMIFSGKAFYWCDFGPSYPNKSIIACLRHAGSGTHATLDAAVMRGDWPLVTAEDAPYVWFNDGSADEMVCINTNGGQSTAGYAAVGYADADQSLTSYPNVAAINYEGAAATKDNIVNGVYSFWSAQWLYECQPATHHTWMIALDAFARDPANLPPSKAAFWATQDEMNVSKANDFAMPQIVNHCQ